MGWLVSRRGPEEVSVDTPTHIPQNDPHNMLIILNIHKWGEIFFKKNCKVRPRGWVKIFTHF